MKHPKLWKDHGFMVCPQTLTPLTPADLVTAPRDSLAKYPAIHFDINQNISEPFCAEHTAA